MKEIIPNRSYADICDKVRNLDPVLSFDDIKVGEIYHIPPFFYSHKRVNLKVLEKRDNSIKCQIMTEGFSNPSIDFKYKSSFDIKFLNKYKNVPKEIEKLFESQKK